LDYNLSRSEGQRAFRPHVDYLRDVIDGAG
jgi:hypothetical protein